MRRFFVWSALAALIGLILAGGGYWAYWNFYARFQPVTVTRHQAEIQRLLDEASWVSGGGGGQPLYVVGYRDSAATQRYEQEEADKLRAAGVEARIILFARPDREGLAQSTPAERATLAELWLTRDWTLYQRWTATPSRDWTAAGVPAADGSLARSAVVEAGRQFVDRLNAYLRDAGVQSRYPLILWRDREGFLKVCACSDDRSWAFIRDDVGAPDSLEPSSVAPSAGDAGADAAENGALPYPTLPPIAPASRPETPATSPNGPGVAPGSSTPAAAAPPRPESRPAARPETRPSNRPAPRPRQDDDTTFF